MRSFTSRTLEVLVVLIALYAIFTVPMGRRTLAGHAAAIFTTPVAKNAASDVTRAVRRLWADRGQPRSPSGEPAPRSR